MAYPVFREEEFPEKIKEISALLGAKRQEGSLSSHDGCAIHYEYYLAQNPKGAVVIVHGFTEFARKYEELTWYFLSRGYHVFLHDLRGHGHSQRQVPELSWTHVEAFEDYVGDLEAYLEEIIRPRCRALPVYLFGHSMGGTLVSAYLLKHPEEFSKAVLSSPMVLPITPVPAWFLRLYVKRYGKKEGWRARFRHSSDFDPNPAFEGSSDTSPNRFRRHIELRLSDPHYQNSVSTNGWMYQALRMEKELLNRKKAGKVTTSVLLIQAGKDTVVCPKGQEKLAKLLPNCRLERFPDAKHTVYNADEAVLGAYVDLLFEFLEG